MRNWRILCYGLVVLVGMAACLNAQSPREGERSRPLWDFFRRLKEPLNACPECPDCVSCETATSLKVPVLSAFSNRLTHLPAGTAPAPVKPAVGPEGAVARVKQDEIVARGRQEAVRYLGTIDCRYWPEAEAALIESLREDRSESVRLEAALALCRGCCQTKCAVAALSIAAAGTNEDQQPAEASERVRAAAALALARCLSGSCLQADEVAARPGEQPAAGNPHLPPYYRQVALLPAWQVAERGRKVLHTSGITMSPASVGAAVAGEPSAMTTWQSAASPLPGNRGAASLNVPSTPVQIVPWSRGQETRGSHQSAPPTERPAGRRVPQEDKRPTIRSVFSQLSGRGSSGPVTVPAKPVVPGEPATPGKAAPTLPGPSQFQVPPPAANHRTATVPAASEPLPAVVSNLSPQRPLKATVSATLPSSSAPQGRPLPDVPAVPQPGGTAGQSSPTSPIRQVSSRTPESAADAPSAGMPGELWGAVRLLRNAPRGTMRQAAAEQLAQSRVGSYPEAVQNLLLSAYRDPVPAVRVASIRALVSMRADSDLVRIVLAELTSDRDPAVRTEAAQAHRQLFPNQPTLGQR